MDNSTSSCCCRENKRNMASRKPRWPSGQRGKDPFDVERESPLRIDSRYRAPFQRPPYGINGTRKYHLRSMRRVISRIKSNNSKNTVQTTTKSSRTLRQGSTSSLGVFRPFWTQSSLEMSKSCHLQRQTRVIWYRPP